MGCRSSNTVRRPRATRERRGERPPHWLALTGACGFARRVCTYVCLCGARACCRGDDLGIKSTKLKEAITSSKMAKQLRKLDKQAAKQAAKQEKARQKELAKTKE